MVEHARPSNDVRPHRPSRPVEHLETWVSVDEARSVHVCEVKRGTYIPGRSTSRLDVSGEIGGVAARNGLDRPDSEVTHIVIGNRPRLSKGNGLAGRVHLNGGAREVGWTVGRRIDIDVSAQETWRSVRAGGRP